MSELNMDANRSNGSKNIEGRTLRDYLLQVVDQVICRAVFSSVANLV